MGSKGILNRIRRKFDAKPASAPFRIITAGKITAGRESFHNGTFKVKGRGLLKVGNFCAFGENITAVLSNHTYTFPAVQYSLYRRLFNEYPYEKQHGTISIGSDVWIGDNVLLLPNITIGNGAIIGGGAVVVKDVPDFAIVGGNPAKVIKYRFTDAQIKKLNETKWWDWTDEQILENRKFFFQTPSE